LKEQTSSSQDSGISFLSGIYSDNRENSPTDSETILQINVENCGKWNLCRSRAHDIVTVPIEWSGSSSVEQDQSDQDVAEDLKSQWISNVEIDTYQPPMIPLWVSGNFKFKTFEAPSEESTVYPDLGDISEDNYSLVSQMSKSVYIKVSEPIPLIRSNQGTKPQIRTEEQNSNLQDDSILKAMATPMVVTNRTPSPTEQSNWELLHADDSTCITTEVESMRKSCLKNFDNGNKMRKSVRLSVDTPQSETDDYFLHSEPTIRGKTSQDINNIIKKSSPKSPNEITANLTLVRPVNRSEKVKTPSPLLKLETGNRVHTPEKATSANGKLLGSFSAVQDYFGDSKMKSSLIGAHAVEAYIDDEERVSSLNPEFEEFGQSESIQNIQHYEPHESLLHGEELKHMSDSIQFESEGSDEDEVEVKHSQVSFKINNDFFSKDRPSVQQVDSFYDDQNRLDMMQFSDMESSIQQSDFKSAYETRMVDTTSRPFVPSERKLMDYDFESDEEDSDS